MNKRKAVKVIHVPSPTPKNLREFLVLIKRHAERKCEMTKFARAVRDEARAVMLEADRLLKHGSTREIARYTRMISEREAQEYVAQVRAREQALRYRERPNCRRTLLKLMREKKCTLHDLWIRRYEMGDGLRCQLAKMIAEAERATG